MSGNQLHRHHAQGRSLRQAEIGNQPPGRIHVESGQAVLGERGGVMNFGAVGAERCPAASKKDVPPGLAVELAHLGVQENPDLAQRRPGAEQTAVEHRGRERSACFDRVRAPKRGAGKRRSGMLDAGDAQSRTVARLRFAPPRVVMADSKLVNPEPEQLRSIGVETLRKREQIVVRFARPARGAAWPRTPRHRPAGPDERR